jgi:hypothetical protein
MLEKDHIFSLLRVLNLVITNGMKTYEIKS